MGKSQDLYKKAKNLIPGGTQLLTKRPEMFLPEGWPAYYDHAKGCEVWDLDNNKYIDMSYMGIGSCILGYADDDIDKAVKDIIDKGSMTTLNAPEEVELAELLCDIHPWAGMVRYPRTGGEAMSTAIRIARTKSGKDRVLFCGYHGWHDWYLSANLSEEKALDGHLLPGLSPVGVPRSLHGTSYPFSYNNTKEFLSLIEKYKNDIGVVVIEPIRNYYPEKEFLDTIRQVTRDLGIILVCDEITSGWRLNQGGAHLKLDIEPDIAVFGKAISNGYPMAAVLGKTEVMEASQESFISSTYWTERIGPTAAINTIKKLKQNDSHIYLENIGKKIQQEWFKSGLKNNLKISTSGIYPLSHFSFDYENALVLKTLFTQLMLEKGFLATNAFYASLAHNDKYIDLYINAVNESFSYISKTIEKGDSEKHLKGPICHSGFRRLT